MSCTKIFVFLLFFSSVASAVSLGESLANDKQPRPVLVELFTSEGCSSCPPADALLRQIEGQRLSSGQTIVALSEHVTYWDSLGWADPFSSRVYTDRQEAYARRFHLDTVYTPQIVVNGSQQVVGSDRAGVLRAVQQVEAPSAAFVHILGASFNGSFVTVAFSVGGAVGNVDLFAVLADNSDMSSVSRGENSGRSLTHVSVARGVARVANVGTVMQGTIRLPVPPSGRGRPTGGRHVILFLQSAGLGPVLSVDSKAL